MATMIQTSQLATHELFISELTSQETDAMRKAEYDRVARLFATFAVHNKYGKTYSLDRIVVLSNQQLEQRFQHKCMQLQHQQQQQHDQSWSMLWFSTTPIQPNPTQPQKSITHHTSLPSYAH
jgi:hypothetical protein